MRGCPDCFHTLALTTRRQKEKENNSMPVEQRAVAGNTTVVCEDYDFPMEPIQLQ